jgi:hypothetical protein
LQLVDVITHLLSALRVGRRKQWPATSQSPAIFCAISRGLAEVLLIAEDARQTDEEYTQAGKAGDTEQIKGSMSGH